MEGQKVSVGEISSRVVNLLAFLSILIAAMGDTEGAKQVGDAVVQVPAIADHAVSAAEAVRSVSNEVVALVGSILATFTKPFISFGSLLKK